MYLLTLLQFVTQRNLDTTNIVATWHTLKCKRHSEHDRRIYPGGHHGCTCQRELERLHANWSCRADTIDRQRLYLERGNRRLNLSYHTHGPQKRRGGFRRVRVEMDKPARRHPITLCCTSRPWLNTSTARRAGGSVGNPLATRACVYCFQTVV